MVLGHFAVAGTMINADPPSAHWMTAEAGLLRMQQAAVAVRFPKKTGPRQEAQMRE
jgi:hypothetical protein